MPVLRSYGAKPAPFKREDFKYARVTAPHLTPPKATVERDGEPVLNQLDEGSCVINALAEAVEHHVPGFLGSRSFGYYKVRVKQHEVHKDNGCDPRIALDTIRHAGLPPEKDWLYDGLAPDRSKMFAKAPPHKINVEAKKLVLEEYVALGQTAGVLNDIRDCIANLKVPVMIGIAVYDSFESDEVARTGKVPLPAANENLVGYHETLLEAYDDSVRLAKVRNSWDRDWGDGGYFYLPYDFISNPRLLTDAFAITKAHLTA